MFLVAVFLLGGVPAAAAEDMIIEAVENTRVSLNCTAVRTEGVEYRSVRWYKEGVDPRLTGLVSRTPPSGPLRWYVDADTNISVEYPSLSLLLPPVSCSDSGVYQCYLAAPVGEQNREGRVRLSVLDCPVEVKETSLTSEVLVLAAGLVLVVFSTVTLTCLCLRRARWNKAKSVDRPLYPDLSYPLEKHGLMLPTFILPQNPKPPALNFSRV